MVPLLPVKSSMLQSIGYDAASRTFAARFNNSNFVHHFRDVPREVAMSVIDETESIGGAFNAHIRGKFEATLIPVGDEPVDALAQEHADASA